VIDCLQAPLAAGIGKGSNRTHAVCRRAGFSGTRYEAVRYCCCRRSGRQIAPVARSLPGGFQRRAPPHEVFEHDLPALHQVFVVIEGPTAPQNPEKRFGSDIHLMPDRRHLQLDDDTAQLLNRASRADPTVAHKGDGFALPFKKRAVEGVLENRRRTVIVLGDRGNETGRCSDAKSPLRAGYRHHSRR
jgi:hypothetical protein